MLYNTYPITPPSAKNLTPLPSLLHAMYSRVRETCRSHVPYVLRNTYQIDSCCRPNHGYSKRCLMISFADAEEDTWEPAECDGAVPEWLQREFDERQPRTRSRATTTSDGWWCPFSQDDREIVKSAGGGRPPVVYRRECREFAIFISPPPHFRRAAASSIQQCY